MKRALDYIQAARERAMDWLPSLTSAFNLLVNFFIRQWILLILLGFIGFFSLVQPRFFTLYNFQNIGVYSTEVLLLALGQTFVIVSGGIDLSVGSVLAFSSVLAGIVMKTTWIATQNATLSILAGIAFGLAVGAALGAANGVLIVKLRVPPFIVTLGMLGIARGGTYIVTKGSSVIDLPPSLSVIGIGQLLGFLPIPVAITIASVIIAHFLLSQTFFGRYTYAMGGNRNAAIRAGISVDKQTVIIYTLSGFFAALSGILVLARFVTASPVAGMNDELNSIAAVVIGGASLFGGTGAIFGSVVGSLIVGVLLVGLIILNVQPYWQMVAVGSILILAVAVDQIRYRGRTLS